MEYRIRAIIFDFGKVLADFDHMKVCGSLVKFTGLTSEQIYSIIFQEGPEKLYDSGLISSIEFYREVKKRIGANADLTFQVFAELWCVQFWPNNEIGRIIADIRPEIKKFLLSNTNELHWENIKKLPVIKSFFSDPDGLILSFRTGLRKPDIRIFQLAIRKAGYSAEEIIFIDDVPEYVDVFRELGGCGIVYNCAINSTIDLLKKLKPFKVFI